MQSTELSVEEKKSKGGAIDHTQPFPRSANIELGGKIKTKVEPMNAFGELFDED